MDDFLQMRQNGWIMYCCLGSDSVLVDSCGELPGGEYSIMCSKNPECYSDMQKYERKKEQDNIKKRKIPLRTGGDAPGLNECKLTLFCLKETKMSV